MKGNFKKIRQVLSIVISLLLIGVVFCGLTTAASYTLGYNKNSSNVKKDVYRRGVINWAILICGSDDFSVGFESDIRDMYVILTDDLQFNDDNIYYVAPGNWNSATHYLYYLKE
jgi:hypothetical protein